MPFDSGRRALLAAVGAGLAATAGCVGLGTDDPPEGTISPTDRSDRPDADVFVDGLSASPPSAAATVAEADLAVFAADAAPADGSLRDAVAAGTAVAVVGDRATRTLVARLREVTLSAVDAPPDSAPSVGQDATFGYQLPGTPTAGVTLALPADDGVVELHRDDGTRDSDEARLRGALRRYRAVINAQAPPPVPAREGGRWRRVARTTAVRRRCPVGALLRVVDCLVHPDTGGLVLWRYRDEAVPAAAADSRCVAERSTTASALRRTTYGDDGTLLDFEPTTGAGDDTIPVRPASVRQAWEYDAAGVAVAATENAVEEAIRWEHAVEDGSRFADRPLVTRPGAVVRYDADASAVSTAYRGEATFAGGETVAASGHGVWPVA